MKKTKRAVSIILVVVIGCTLFLSSASAVVTESTYHRDVTVDMSSYWEYAGHLPGDFIDWYSEGKKIVVFSHNQSSFYVSVVDETGTITDRGINDAISDVLPARDDVRSLTIDDIYYSKNLVFVRLIRLFDADTGDDDADFASSTYQYEYVISSDFGENSFACGFR